MINSRWWFNSWWPILFIKKEYSQHWHKVTNVFKLYILIYRYLYNAYFYRKILNIKLIELKYLNVKSYAKRYCIDEFLFIFWKASTWLRTNGIYSNLFRTEVDIERIRIGWKERFELFQKLFLVDEGIQSGCWCNTNENVWIRFKICPSILLEKNIHSRKENVARKFVRRKIFM